MLIARRLFLVALTDFLCWFPVGIMGMMAELGVDIPPEVLVLTFLYERYSSMYNNAFRSEFQTNCSIDDNKYHVTSHKQQSTYR